MTDAEDLREVTSTVPTAEEEALAKPEDDVFTDYPEDEEEE